MGNNAAASTERTSEFSPEVRAIVYGHASLRWTFRDEDVVPNSDDPLRGWLRWGARRLSLSDWPEVARCNPVLAYLAGRRRDAQGEDWFGALPWIVFAILNAGAAYALRNNPKGAIAAAWVELMLMPIVASLLSSIMVGRSVRESLRDSKIDELLVTPLTPTVIAQGLSIRPMSMQGSARVIFILTTLVAALFWLPMSGYVGLLAMVLWAIATEVILGFANEIGGAFGLRAHLCIRAPGKAMLRAFLDELGWGIAFLFVAGIAAGLATAAFGVGIVAWIVTLAAFRFATRIDTERAYAFCSKHPEEWWYSVAAGHESAFPERGLKTRWKTREEMEEIAAYRKGRTGVRHRETEREFAERLVAEVKKGNKSVTKDAGEQ